MHATQLSDDEFRLRVGAGIARRREARGMNKSALAEAAGTQTIRITRIERGENAPGGALLLRIAQALDTSVEALVADGAEAGAASENGAD